MAEEKTEVEVLCEKLLINKKHSANFVDEAEFFGKLSENKVK